MKTIVILAFTLFIGVNAQTQNKTGGMIMGTHVISTVQYFNNDVPKYDTVLVEEMGSVAFVYENIISFGWYNTDNIDYTIKSKSIMEDGHVLLKLIKSDDYDNEYVMLYKPGDRSYYFGEPQSWGGMLLHHITTANPIFIPKDLSQK